MTSPQIHVALAAVMADCTHVAKRDRNEHQRFLFRGIDAVVNAVGPILRKHGVTVRPVVQTVTYDLVQTSTGKSATACRLVADYVFAAQDGSEVTATVAAEAWDHGDKAAPKAMSVAFRTALLQTLALPTDEPDPDSHSYQRDASAAQAITGGGKITDAQSKKMHAMLRELGREDRDDKIRLAVFITGRQIESTSELTAAEAKDVIDYLATRIADAKRDAAPEPTTESD